MSKTLSEDAVASMQSIRATGLFVVRESDEWDLELFNAMREQTYLNHRAVAEVEAIRKVGLAPLEGDSFEVAWETADGRPRSTRVIVETIKKGNTKAVLFFFAGYWHLWSRASAATVGGEGVNDFTAILIEVIKRLRPTDLYAANFSRLIRSQTQGSRLQSVLEGNVDAIHAGSVTFPLTGQQAQIGLMMFSMFSLVASMERDWIVQRLLAGRVAKWRRGEWPFGKGTVPFGYYVDPNTHKLCPDPDARDAVREMLMVLSKDSPPSQLVKELNRAGVVSMRKHRRLKEHVPAGATTSPNALVDSLYAWAPLWCQGEYLFRVTNVFPGMEELAGVPIVRDPRNPGDLGEMQMLYQVGVPEDGWAEPEILAAFAEKAAANTLHMLENRKRTNLRPLAADVAQSSANPALHVHVLSPQNTRGLDRKTRNRRAAARAKGRISALAGRTWTDGSWRYELHVCRTDMYKILRWPLRADDAAASADDVTDAGEDGGVR